MARQSGVVMNQHTSHFFEALVILQVITYLGADVFTARSCWPTLCLQEFTYCHQRKWLAVTFLQNFCWIRLLVT